MLTRQGTHFKPRFVPRWAIGFALAVMVVVAAAMASGRDRTSKDEPVRLLSDGTSTTRPAVTSTELSTTTSGLAGTGRGSSPTNTVRGSSSASRPRATSGSAVTSRPTTSTTHELTPAEIDAADDVGDAPDGPGEDTP